MAVSKILKLKSNEWLGFDSAITDEVAKIHGARRLGCKPKQIEMMRTGGAVLVRIKKENK